MSPPQPSRLARTAVLLTGLAIVLSIALAAPRPAAAAGPNGDVQTAGDLLDLCADTSDASRIACKFYVLGALQSAAIMHAADAGKAHSELYCASASTTTGDLIAAVQSLVAAHPDRRDFTAASVVVGGAMEAFPCKPSPRTSHHRRTHRTR